MTYHNPVLLAECIEALNIRPDGIYVDLTFGSGGHSREILKHLTTGKLIGFDQDPDAKVNLIDDQRFLFVNENFRFFRNFLKHNGIEAVDGVLADLGVSSHQIDCAERGFSFMQDANLDMRMDTTSAFSAEVLLNTYDAERLAKIFWLYGEVENSRNVARQIIQFREFNELKTTADLKKAIEKSTPKFSEYKFWAKIFQAIRIAVNEEMDVLEEMLLQTTKIVKPGGRLVIMSYHSLEDRMVKNFIRSGNLEGKVEQDMYGNIIAPFVAENRKVIVPSEKEIEENNRARSAKLRIATKK